MNKGYVVFVGVLAALWIATMVIDIIMTCALYPSRFGAIASLTGSIGSQFRIPIYVIIGLPEAIGLFYPPYLFWAIWIGIVSTAVIIFIVISLYGSFPKFENSSLYRISEFFAVNLFLSYVYIVFVALIGHPIVSPISPNPENFVYNFFQLTNAGLYEELITRVVYIGVPLFAYYAWTRHGKRSPSRPKSLPLWRILWGGGYKLGKPEIIVLVISSLIFGIAHAGSWDVSKIPQAALGGVFLGLLYMRFGLYADVLFHFSIDSPSLLLTNLYGNPLATAGSTDLYSLVLFVFLAAGLIIVVVYIIEIGKWYRRGKRGNFAPAPSTLATTDPQSDLPSMNRSTSCSNCRSRNVTPLYDDVCRCDDCGSVFRRGQ